MNLEEIRQLSDEKLCLELLIATDDWYAKQKDKLRQFSNRNVEGCPTHLCTDLNEIAEVEKLVINKLSKAELYGQFVFYSMFLKQVVGQTKINLDDEIATATARERAEACLLCLQNLDTE